MDQPFRKDSIIEFVFLLSFASPILSFIFRSYIYETLTFYKFYGIIMILSGLYLIFQRKVFLPKYITYLIAYAIFLFLNDLYRGIFNEQGILLYFVNRNILPLVFALILIENTTMSPKFVKLSLNLISLTILASALVSIIQFYDDSFFSLEQSTIAKSKYLVRRVSIFSFDNPLNLGLTLIPFCFAKVNWNLLYPKGNAAWFILVFSLVGISAILSNARWVMINFLIILILFLVINRRLSKKNYLIISILITIPILYFILKYILELNFILWFDQRIFAEESIYNTTRFHAIKLFMEVFPQKPIFGNGFFLSDEIKEAAEQYGSSQIHIGYLAHLVSYGIVGTSLFLLFVIHLTKDQIKIARSTGFYGGLVAIILYLVANLTLVSHTLFFYGILWSFIYSKYLYSIKKQFY